MRHTRPGNSTQPPPPRTHRSPVVLEDLLAGLLWPRLLQTWKVALAPGRVFLCFLLVAALFLMDRSYAWVHSRQTGFDETGPLWFLISKIGEYLDLTRDAIFADKTPLLAAPHVFDLFVSIPLSFTKRFWPAMLTIMPLAVVLWSIIGGAVCRGAACEVSLRATVPWRSALWFGITKAPAFIASFVGPLVIVWVLAAGCALVGKLLFWTKLTSVLGGVGFGVFIVIGFIAAVVMLGFLVGHFMLIPALACEGTDSFDAVQRTYAYVIARPGRLALYAFIIVLTMTLAVALAQLVGGTAFYFAVHAGRAPVEIGQGGIAGYSGEQYGVTVWAFRMWTVIGIMVIVAYLLSLYFCASTTLYLIMRRLVDGQDIGELWVPVKPVPGVVDAAVSAIPEKADYQ